MRPDRMQQALSVNALLLMVLAAVPANAAEIETLTVENDGGRFRVDARAVLAAPRAALFAVLTDYENLDRLDKTLLESKRMEAVADGVYLVYTRARVCVLFFCRAIERVERIAERPPGEIEATALPAQSDVLSGHSHWELEQTEKADHTRVRYRLDVEPSGIPAFSRGAVRRRLERSVRASLAAAERLATEAEAEAETEASQ